MKNNIIQSTKQRYFSTLSEYLRHLVQQNIQKMENYLNEGIRSGKSRYTSKEIFENAKKLVAQK